MHNTHTHTHTRTYILIIFLYRKCWYKYIHVVICCCGSGSVVGIANAYELDGGGGIESRWGEIFRTIPDRPWGPSNLLYNGYCVFPGGKVLPGRDADPSTLLMQRFKIEWSYTSTLP